MSNTQSEPRYSYGVGRRKRSTARAKIFPANELVLTVNKQDPKTYFSDYFYQILATMLANLGIKQGKIDIFVNGGGINGQAEAARLAIAKALIVQDPTMRPALRLLGYITTDVRKVLPKRPGLRKARKSEQWSKR